MKRFIRLSLAVILMAGLVVSAFATGGGEKAGPKKVLDSFIEAA